MVLACKFKAWDSVLLLLSKGADPNKAAIDEDGDVFTPLNLAISSGCSTDICRSLLESGAGETPGFFRGYKWVRHVHLPFPPVLTQVTPLLAACMNRAWDLALLLLSKGADPNTAATYEDGKKSPIQTPLYLSAVWGSIDVCKSLLASGARPFGSRNLFNHLYDQFDQNLHTNHTNAARISYGDAFQNCVKLLEEAKTGWSLESSIYKARSDNIQYLKSRTPYGP